MIVGRAAALTVALAATGCTEIVRYTDALVDPTTGRTLVVRTPATFGGVLGLVLGLPVDVLALPVTYGYYELQPADTRDPLSIFLFPSFVLWRLGTLLGAPFDVLEFAFYRGWMSPPALSPEERERLELELDESEMPDYPVQPIYPKPARG